MDIIFQQKELLSVLTQVTKCSSKRDLVPILANVLFSANNGEIRLSASDQEVYISMQCPGEIISPGRFTVPAKKILPIVQALPSEKLSCSVMTNDMVEIKGVSFIGRIRGMTADEFPSYSVMTNDILEMDAKIFSSLLKSVAYAISNDETRHFLNGVFFFADGHFLDLVATDGKRLVISKYFLDDNTIKMSGIIPKRAVEIIPSIFQEGNIKIGVSDNLASFQNNGTTFITRLIDGEYPDYNAILSTVKDNGIIVEISRQQLMDAISRVSVMADSRIPSIKMDMKSPTGSLMRISAQTPGIGESQEDIKIDITGEGIEVCVNPNFIQQALSLLVSDNLQMRFRDPEAPFSISFKESQVAVIMPKRF